MEARVTTPYDRDKSELALSMVAFVRQGRPHFDNVDMIRKVFREQSSVHYSCMDFSNLASLLESKPELGRAAADLTAGVAATPSLGNVIVSTLSRAVAAEMEPVAFDLSFEFWEGRVVGLLAHYCDVGSAILKAGFPDDEAWWPSEMENSLGLFGHVVSGRREAGLPSLMTIVDDAAKCMQRAADSGEVAWWMPEAGGVDKPAAVRVVRGLENLMVLAKADEARLAKMFSEEVRALERAEDRIELIENLKREAASPRRHARSA